MDCNTVIDIKCKTKEGAEKIYDALWEWYDEDISLAYFLSKSKTPISGVDSVGDGYIDSVYKADYKSVNLIVWTESIPLIDWWTFPILSHWDQEIETIDFVASNFDERKFWSNRSDYQDRYYLYWNVSGEEFFTGDITKQALCQFLMDFLHTRDIYFDKSDVFSLIDEIEYLDLDCYAVPYEIIC